MREPGGRGWGPFTGDPKDMYRKALEMGVLLHRGSVGDPLSGTLINLKNMGHKGPV